MNTKTVKAIIRADNKIIEKKDKLLLDAHSSLCTMYAVMQQLKIPAKHKNNIMTELERTLKKIEENNTDNKPFYEANAVWGWDNWEHLSDGDILSSCFNKFIKK